MELAPLGAALAIIVPRFVAFLDHRDYRRHQRMLVESTDDQEVILIVAEAERASHRGPATAASSRLRRQTRRKSGAPCLRDRPRPS